MHSRGSGHVHGGRDGRMSFEQKDLSDQLVDQLREEELLPPNPLARHSRELDAEARAYFRRKVDRL